jgi:PAS domain S-box-containing protein
LLDKFMVNGEPDRDRFTRVVGCLLVRILRNGPRIRAFGEMVAILFERNNSPAAIRLEELWNELAESYRFILFCAYPMSLFKGNAQSGNFRAVCDQHSRVLPAESYAPRGSTADERLRTISFLQQQAASLQAEIATRMEAEKKLARRERELTDFLENGTEGIHQVAADGTILWANKAELDMLGYTADDYIGKPISDFYADPALVQDILFRLKRGETLCDQEACLKHKDGSVRYVSINSNGFWENNQFVHTRSFTRHIT